MLAVVFGQALLPGRRFAGGDWDVIILPFAHFVREVWDARGELPVWNPYILGGLPHQASLNALTAYPTEWLGLAAGLSPERFYVLDTCVHFWLAAVAIEGWMRREGLPAAASFTGGLFYMLGGHVLVLAGAGQPITIRCVALLPLVFRLLEARGGAGAAAAAGAVIGLMLLTCGVQTAAYVLAVAGVWIAARGGGGAAGRVGRIAVCWAAALGLGAAVWVPGLEYHAYSIRSGTGFQASQGGLWQLTSWDLLTLVLPDVFGHGQGYAGPHPFRTTSDYPGLLVLGLAIVGAAGGTAGRRWIWLIPASLVLAAGTATPAGRVLALLPGYGGFRASLRWLAFLHLALAVLAAHGAARLLAGSARAGRRAAAGGLAFAVACLALAAGPLPALVAGAPFVRDRIATGATRAELAEAQAARAAVRGAAAAAGAAGALAAAAAPGLSLPARAGALMLAGAADLLHAGFAQIRVATAAEPAGPDPVSASLLARGAGGEPGGGGGAYRAMSAEPLAHVLPNVRIRHRVRWAQGLHALPLAGWVGLLEAGFTTPAVLRVLNVRWHVLPGRGIVEDADALPRAFFAREAVPCADAAAALAVMRAPGWDPRRAPVAGPGSGPLAAEGLLRAEFGAREIRGEAVVEAPALLVFSEAWYPAWRARVDGRRVPILRPYGGLRGLALEPGTHRFEMRYESWTLKVGVWASLLAVAGLGAALASVRRGG